MIEKTEAQKRTESLLLAGLKSRRAKEKRFVWLGRGAIAIALFFLATLFISIGTKGIPGFFQYYVTLEVSLDRARLDPAGDLSDQSCFDGEAKKLVNEAIYAELVTGRKPKKAARSLLSNGSDVRLVEFVKENPQLLNSVHRVKLALDDDADSYLRGFISKDTPEKLRRIDDQQIAFLEALQEKGLITREISDYLFFGSASRNAEMAGIKGALFGSMLTLFICFIIAFPLGVATAIYLEVFAPKNKFTEIIEVNINNLARAIGGIWHSGSGNFYQSVWYAALGTAGRRDCAGADDIANHYHSSRASLRAVPPSIRDGALGIGASEMQATFHHVVPLAIPGMLTGSIIGMAQALGETAPLLMIGMVAFIVDIPNSVLDPGTVLPVQIFMWADFAERMFIQKTSSAIIILLAFLIVMNGIAIFIRRKLERRW